MISLNYPCKYLPTRDTRFINITKPTQLVGDPFLESTPDSDSDDSTFSLFPSPPTRICGGFYLSLPPKSAGSFRRVTLLNQESFVIMASSGAWRIEECSLQASGVGGLGADIMHAENLAQVRKPHALNLENAHVRTQDLAQECTPLINAQRPP